MNKLMRKQFVYRMSNQERVCYVTLVDVGRMLVKPLTKILNSFTIIKVARTNTLYIINKTNIEST